MPCSPRLGDKPLSCYCSPACPPTVLFTGSPSRVPTYAHRDQLSRRKLCCGSGHIPIPIADRAWKKMRKRTHPRLPSPHAELAAYRFADAFSIVSGLVCHALCLGPHKAKGWHRGKFVTMGPLTCTRPVPLPCGSIPQRVVFAQCASPKDEERVWIYTGLPTQPHPPRNNGAAFTCAGIRKWRYRERIRHALPCLFQKSKGPGARMHTGPCYPRLSTYDRGRPFPGSIVLLFATTRASLSCWLLGPVAGQGGCLIRACSIACTLPLPFMCEPLSGPPAHRYPRIYCVRVHRNG